MTTTPSLVARVVGPNGKSAVSFHDAWPLSQSEVVFQKGGPSPTRGEVGYKELIEPIRYASSF
ncbi:MAG TPA: hypothetical protein VKY26_10965 [Actinomycetota bacterium]|nr:hypothetical protein [Actinomycetota bacterium]